jgi:hypothetical protein
MKPQKAESGRFPGCGTWLFARSFASAAGNAVLGLRSNRPASVAQIAPRLFAYCATDVFGNPTSARRVKPPLRSKGR